VAVSRPPVAIVSAGETTDCALGAIASSAERVITSLVAIRSFAAASHLFAGER
jgi:hypothetical protein